MCYLKNEIVYYRPQHDHPVAFNVSSIAPQALSYDPQKINLDMQLEHLGDSSVQGGCGWWMVSMERKRVSLGFTYPPEAKSTDDSMPRSVVSKLCCGAPMNWGTLQVLASSEIVVLNPNGMWSLKNEIRYFRPQHHHPIAFDSSSIALTSSELWPSEDWPQNALRAPWRLLDTGWPQTMDGLRGWNKGVTRVHLPTWS